MSKRYPGGYLTASPVTPTSTAAPGVWTLEQQYQAQGAGNWPAAANYQINKSLRFRSSASANLTRTPASTGNRQIWTWSAWVKLGTISASNGTIFNAGTTSGETTSFYIRYTSDAWQVGTRNINYFTTSNLYRDPGAWCHVVCAYDSTQATASNRILFYVNGASATYTFGTNVTLNNNSAVNNTVQHDIGYDHVIPGGYFDGELAEVNFIDGSQLTPSSFGTTDAYGIWQPIKYSGSYGTNGYYLPFTNTTSTTTLGYDSSGNGNNWTTNNFSLTTGSTYDSMYDSPTNNSSTVANYCTLNPLAISNVTMSNGNLSFATSGNNSTAWSTMAVNTGKWYFEFSKSSGDCAFMMSQVPKFGGFQPSNVSTGLSCLMYGTGTGNEIYYLGSPTSFPAGWGTGGSGDIIGILLDFTVGTLTIRRNNDIGNQMVYSMNPALYAQPLFVGYSVTTTWPASNFTYNFGQQPFVYTIPDGYLPLNTYNLPDSVVPVGGRVMTATTYSGTGASATISNASTGSSGFYPDLSWIKARNDTSWHQVFDSIRGANKGIYPNSDYQETTQTDAFNAFGSTGFTLGADAAGGSVNKSGNTYVGWQWNAGSGTTSSNTNGSVTSTINVNQTSGFSICRFTAPSSGAFTIGHGLGVKPAMFIIKELTLADGWVVWHQSLSNQAQSYLMLNGTNASADNASVWNNTAPTSSLISLQAGYAMYGNSVTMAYCWAPVAGYSAFGSYTGNGSSDGPFIYTGFRPKFILTKRTDSTTGADWRIHDTAINPYNVAQTYLAPNLSNVENTGNNLIDILSNGFKFRNSLAGENASGGTYIYAAFAENPFKMARAR